MSDPIDRQAVIDALSTPHGILYPIRTVEELPSAESERLTDDDFEIIRIHLNAIKEKLCNQQRWKETEDYQRIIDRVMAFASAEPERKKGRLINPTPYGECSECGYLIDSREGYNFCPNCGADMRGDDAE